MTQDAERDPVEDALLQMGLFDEREVAIERAEAEGVVAEAPELSSAKVDAIVAASLRAAEPEAEAVVTPLSQARRWIPWACGFAVAVAAALVLWQGFPVEDPAAVNPGPLPSAQLKLGGTARTLGDAPAVRAYGPGDAFFVELSFDEPPAAPIEAQLYARDAAGVQQPIPLTPRQRKDVTVFEGQIADLLPPGTWTLHVRYGERGRCSDAAPDKCEVRETRIEVIGR